MSSQVVGIERFLSDNPNRLLFPYRLGVDPERYISDVVDRVVEAVESGESSLSLSLLFVRGVPSSFARLIRDHVLYHLEVVIPEDVLLDVRVFTDISVVLFRHLELLEWGGDVL